MPLWEFICRQGHRTDELFGAGEEPPDTLRCDTCGQEARRRRIYPTRVVGPVFEHMERAEAALLTPAERRAGRRFRGPADIEAAERALCEREGVSRPEDHTLRAIESDQMDEARTLARVRKQEGEPGMVDFMKKEDTMAETGWDSATYSRWKDMTDAAQRRIDSGADIVSAGE